MVIAQSVLHHCHPGVRLRILGILGVLYIAVNRVPFPYILYTSPHLQGANWKNKPFDVLEQMYSVYLKVLRTRLYATPLADGPPLAVPSAFEALNQLNRSYIFSIILLSYKSNFKSSLQPTVSPSYALSSLPTSAMLRILIPRAIPSRAATGPCLHTIQPTSFCLIKTRRRGYATEACETLQESPVIGGPLTWKSGT